MVEVLLYGELDKWVPMSPQRVHNIEVTADNIHIDLRGASNEKVIWKVKWVRFRFRIYSNIFKAQ